MSDEAKPAIEPSACPKCGATWYKTGVNYECRTIAEFWDDDGNRMCPLQQSKQCRIAELERENAELRQMIAEDCCSKLEANKRIANAQAEAAKVYGPVIDELREKLKEPHPARDFVNECNAIIAAKDKELAELRQRLEAAETALEKIANPLVYAKKTCPPDRIVSPQHCLMLANTPGYLRNVADDYFQSVRAALAPKETT